MIDGAMPYDVNTLGIFAFYINARMKFVLLLIWCHGKECSGNAFVGKVSNFCFLII